jgi:hypothetical protein
MEDKKNIKSKNYSVLVNEEINNNDLIINDDEIEMKTVPLNCENTEGADNKMFIVRKKGFSNTEVDTKYFKMKNCKRVRSILYEGTTYNSIYNPKDDTHAFYIIRDKNGNFHQRENKGLIHNKKRTFLKNELERFISRFNEVVDIFQIKSKMRCISLIKSLIYFGMFVVLCLLSYYFFFCLVILIAILMNNNDQINQMTPSYYFFGFSFSIVFMFCLYIILTIYKSKEKIILFTYLLTRRRDLELELGEWNESTFYPYNMKLVLSETFDYVGVFYDKEIEYEIEEHQF